MVENVSGLVQKVRTYEKETHGKVLQAFFEENTNAEGVVIIEGTKPIGLISRNDFYQKFGSQFGYTLFMNRPISLIMNTSPMIVESSTSVTEVCFQAMNREQAYMYDLVIVAESGTYIGVISIKLFLIELTRQKEKENIAIRNLLDNAGQGFLSFGKDLIISEEYSQECVNIFERPIDGNFIDLLHPYIDSHMEKLIMEVFNGAFKVIEQYRAKVFLSLLPEELVINRKNIRMDHKVIHDSTEYKVMLIFTDITEKTELETQAAKERNNLKLIIKAISNQNDMSVILKDLKEFLGYKVPETIFSCKPINEMLFDIYRAIHTFKGDFGQLYMYNTAYMLHETENNLSDLMQRMDTLDKYHIKGFIDQIDYHTVVKEDLNIIKNALGENYLNEGVVFTISREKITEIEEEIIRILPPDQQNELLPMIKSLRYCSFKNIIRQYDDYLQNLAQKLDKRISNLYVYGDDIFIDKCQYQRFINSLVHIFRNMVDHGIEMTDERLAAGKPDAGAIDCELTQNGNDLTIKIRDDGKGIDFAKVIRKALDKKLLSDKELHRLTVNEQLELLFIDGFSTRDTVSMTSGRGMGLGTVKHEVESLGGNMQINTEPGKWTEFIISIPILR